MRIYVTQDCRFLGTPYSVGEHEVDDDVAQQMLKEQLAMPAADKKTAPKNKATVSAPENK